jgi:iron complex outermembrane receptor protein
MRRTFLHRIVLSGSFFLFVNSSSFSQNGTIAGRVKYGLEALQAATVSVDGEIILTDQKGGFLLTLKPGKYSLAITHAGYLKVEQIISVEAGVTKNLVFDMMPNALMGEVVTLGSRSLTQRSNLNTAFPVDAFSSGQLSETGQTSLMQMLNYTAPSLNASMQNAYEPVTLRGLYPDQILILLNGTRYNNTASINYAFTRGQLGRGGVGNDLNSIPFSAIDKIEILRDGASAQYGSDAVAGVINIKLKESTGKTNISIHLGQQYKGDGETMKLGIYRGFSLNKKGFLNFSADFWLRNPTIRGADLKGTVYKNFRAGASPADSARTIFQDDSTIRARGFDRSSVSNAGNTKLVSFGSLINGNYPINSKTRIFWTVSINNLNFETVIPTILPKNTGQVNTELYPDGFKPRLNPDIWNVSGIVGAQGMAGKKIHWEYSSAYGLNAARSYSENTNNASQQFTLGKSAPTGFYTGTLIYQQLTNTIHFIRNFTGSESKLMNSSLDWGAELRVENFQMKAGDEASWNNYDSTHRKAPGVQAGQVVAPLNVLNKKRSVICAYVDFEADLNPKFLLGVAVRFEHYNDFGSNLAGKLAARYKMTDNFTIRGSINNGFRAPSMQQLYWSNINYGMLNGAASSFQLRFIPNNENAVTKVFGVPVLEPEKSLNLGAGLTSTFSRTIYLTLDGYWIRIKNRVVLSGVFDRATNHEVDSLLRDPSLANLGLPYIDRVAFFSNAINIRTVGIDAVLHGQWNFHKSQFIAVLSANFTRTRLFGEIKTAANLSATDGNRNTLFGEEQKANLENAQPQSKIILSLNYKREKIGFLVRNTRFGATAFDHVNGSGKVQPSESFSPKILTDLLITYTPKSWLTVSAGANNIFDIYPDHIKNYQNTDGGIYLYAMESSPFGYNGGYYYVGMDFNF